MTSIDLEERVYKKKKSISTFNACQDVSFRLLSFWTYVNIFKPFTELEFTKSLFIPSVYIRICWGKWLNMQQLSSVRGAFVSRLTCLVKMVLNGSAGVTDRRKTWQSTYMPLHSTLMLIRHCCPLLKQQHLQKDMKGKRGRDLQYRLGSGQWHR